MYRATLRPPLTLVCLSWNFLFDVYLKYTITKFQNDFVRGKRSTVDRTENYTTDSMDAVSVRMSLPVSFLIRDITDTNHPPLLLSSDCSF